MSTISVNTQKVIDMLYACSMGMLTDGNISIGKVQGYTATSATTAKSVYSTTYTPQGTNAQRSHKSSSANDAAAGTGARTILLTYLDQAFALRTESVTLNGTVAVATVASDIAYVESITVTSVGSGGVSAGTITSHSNNSGGGTTVASIVAGEMQTFYAHHYVPASKTCYLLNLGAGGTVVAGKFNFSFQDLTATTNPNTPVGGLPFIHPAAQYFNQPFQAPLAVATSNIITVIETPIAATANVTWAGFEYIQF